MSADVVRTAPAATLGEWLDVVDARGWSAPDAWLLLDACARAAVRALRGVRAEDEELVSEVIWAAKEVPAAWRKRALRSVRLDSWLAGWIKNRPRKGNRRKSPQLLGDAAERIAAADPDDHAGPSDAELARLVDPAEVLTPKQLECFNLHLHEGLGCRRGGKRLGISREAFRDRLRGALARMKSRKPAPRPRDVRRLEAMAADAAARGKRDTALLCTLRAVGTSYAACARALRTTAQAAASRLARLWKASLAAAATDTPPPCPALKGGDRDLAGSQGGSRGSAPADPMAPRSGGVRPAAPCAGSGGTGPDPPVRRSG